MFDALKSWLSPVISSTQYLLKGYSQFHHSRQFKDYIDYTRKCHKDAVFDRVLLSPSVKLLDRTQLIEELLVDQPRNLKKLVVGNKLIQDLTFHAPGLEV